MCRVHYPDKRSIICRRENVVLIVREQARLKSRERNILVMLVEEKGIELVQRSSALIVKARGKSDFSDSVKAVMGLVTTYLSRGRRPLSDSSLQVKQPNWAFPHFSTLAKNGKMTPLKLLFSDGNPSLEGIYGYCTTRTYMAFSLLGRG